MSARISGPCGQRTRSSAVAMLSVGFICANMMLCRQSSFPAPNSASDDGDLTRRATIAKYPRPLVRAAPAIFSTPEYSDKYSTVFIPTFNESNLQLYVRLSFTRSWGEARSICLPTLQLFWPHVRTHLVFDAEELDGELGKEAIEGISAVKESLLPLRVTHTAVHPYFGYGLEGTPGGPDCKCVWGGYQRGHLDMMFADQLISSKFVGLMDTDAMFITLVTPSALFSSDGKPRVFGVLGRSLRGTDVMWRNAVPATAFMLKKDFVVSCMSYFPVILKTKHIAEMRAYVERVHGRPFVEVYKEMFKRWGQYCHFSFMCNYVWHFHYDEYVWHYQNYHKNRSGWDAPVDGQIRDFSFLKDGNAFPRARVTTHATYTAINRHLHWRYEPVAGAVAIARAFCFVALAQCKTNEECEKWRTACRNVYVRSLNTFQTLLFRFERQLSWEWDPETKAAQALHYESVKTSPSWIRYGQSILSRKHPEAWNKLAVL